MLMENIFRLSTIFFKKNYKMDETAPRHHPLSLSLLTPLGVLKKKRSKVNGLTYYSHFNRA